VRKASSKQQDKLQATKRKTAENCGGV